MLGRLLPGVQHLQNAHPLIVHFPIAFLFGAALLYFLAWIGKRESWSWTGLWMLVLGTLAAAVAAGSGLYGAEGVMIAPSVNEHLLINHERIMLGVLELLRSPQAKENPLPAYFRVFCRERKNRRLTGGGK
jgi:uncharacterized membrane protein